MTGELFDSQARISLRSQFLGVVHRLLSLMAKKKNLAAVASSSRERPDQQLKDLLRQHSRLVTEKAELQKLVKLLNAKLAFDRDGPAICAANPMMAETTADPASTSCLTSVETPELQEEVKNLESEHSEVVPPHPEVDLMAEEASDGIGKEVEDSVEGKRMESAAYVEEQILRMEERFKKLEEKRERREILLGYAMEEVVLLKNRLEEKNSRWSKWILAGILWAVGVAFVGVAFAANAH